MGCLWDWLAVGGTGIARDVGMTPAFFELKHGHLSALRLSRVFTRDWGITPARLDVLRVLVEARRLLKQHEVQRRLNALKSVLSVMVRALEEEGFVRRTRCPTDRRTFFIALTEKGKWVLRKIYFQAMTAGLLPLALMSIFSTPENRAPLSTWRVALDRIVKWIRPIRAWGLGIPRELWLPTKHVENFYLGGITAENPNRDGEDGYLVLG